MLFLLTENRRSNKCPELPPVGASNHHGNQQFPSNRDSQSNMKPCDRTRGKPTAPRNSVYPAQPSCHRNLPSNHSVYPDNQWSQNYLAPPGGCRDTDSIDGMSDGGTTTSGSYVVDPDQDVLDLEDGPHISSDVFV